MRMQRIADLAQMRRVVLVASDRAGIKPLTDLIARCRYHRPLMLKEAHARLIEGQPDEVEQTLRLPALVREECRELLDLVAEKTVRIDAKTKKIKALAAETDIGRRLRTMPGVGPLTALAVEAFAPDMTSFKRGRDFAAWLGLVPRQRSSGGKERLGRVSKAGQADIRRLLIIGAMSRLNWLGRKSILEGSWLARMLAKKPRMLVAIALANKMARAIWAMLTKKEDYRDPALAVAA